MLTNFPLARKRIPNIRPFQAAKLVNRRHKLRKSTSSHIPQLNRRIVDLIKDHRKSKSQHQIQPEKAMEGCQKSFHATKKRFQLHGDKRLWSTGMAWHPTTKHVRKSSVSYFHEILNAHTLEDPTDSHGYSTTCHQYIPSSSRS